MNITTVELNPAIPAADLVEALKHVYDPELGVDIVNLGLVYGVSVVDRHVEITMTLTTPGCPMHGSIERDVRTTLERLPGVRTVDVQLSWDPPWTPEAMSDEAKGRFGWM